jgi:hypothetical protein
LSPTSVKVIVVSPTANCCHIIPLTVVLSDTSGAAPTFSIAIVEFGSSAVKQRYDYRFGSFVMLLSIIQLVGILFGPRS